MIIKPVRILERPGSKVLLRKLTVTEKGEYTLRLPKDIIRTLKLKNDFVIVHRIKRALWVEAASQRLADMGKVRVKRLWSTGERRLLDKKRLSSIRKAT